MMTDTQDYAFTLAQHLALSPPIGPLAIVITDEDAYWASTAGVHSLDVAVRYGHHPVTCVSRPIAPLLRESGAVIRGRWAPERKTVVWEIGKQALAYDYGRSEKSPGGAQMWLAVNSSELLSGTLED